MGHRSLAFLLDCVLVGVLTLFLLDRILLPMYYPEEHAELKANYIAYQEAFEEAREKKEPNPPYKDYFRESEEYVAVSQFGLYIVMLLFFAYFFVCELFMRGATLGKKMFRIQTIILGVNQPPGGLQALLRAAMKTLMLIGLAPLSWIGFIMAFFTPHKRSAHDILTRTLVVRESEQTVKGVLEES